MSLSYSDYSYTPSSVFVFEISKKLGRNIWLLLLLHDISFITLVRVCLMVRLGSREGLRAIGQ